MQLLQNSVERHYDLRMLGLLDGPPLKAASIVTEITWENLQAACAAFIVFDDNRGDAVMHATARRLKPGTRYPLHSAAVAKLRDAPNVAQVVDLQRSVPSPAEHTEFGLATMLAAPVVGPDRQPIGALAAFDVRPREWSPMKYKQLEDLAYLVTQEVMLHASFATLELMAGERALYNA